nr:pentatricopeptide repeat-containing protein [Tanacetum cinerariifolium]
MAPSGSFDDLLFDVHNNEVFFFLPLRYENGVVYQLRVNKDEKMDYNTLCLKLIENDSDLFVMYDYDGMYGILDMYVEEEAEQLNPPPKLKTVTKVPKGREEPRVVDTCDNFIGDSLEVEMHAPRVVDKGKAKMLDDELVVKHRKATVKNKGIVIEENKNPTFINDTSSDSDSEPMFNNNVYSGSGSESSYSDKSVDYLSEGEDETPSDDVDHIRCFRPKSVFDIHEAHHVLEHERFMNELLRKLKDGKNGITDPFRLVEHKVEQYPIHNEQTHWRMSKPKVDKVIAKCSVRPEIVKDPSIGKQRKFYRYPSKGKGDASECSWRCYGKLNVENKDNWSWFLKLLGDDIDLPTGNVENGFSECFNSMLLQVRDKPLITMLEAMRVIVLERMNTMRNLLETWSEDIFPNIQKRLELAKDQQRLWHVRHAGGNLFKVRNRTEAFKVNEQLRTCGCRMWQLLGLPCPHAIIVLFKLNKRPEDYVLTCFRKDSSEMPRVLPPKPKTMPGRPRKKRIRAPHENKNNNRVSKARVQMTCQNCFQNGHNKKSCLNAKVVKESKPPCKIGSGTIMGAGIAMRNSKIQRSKRGMGNKGKFVKKVIVGKFGCLGRWFGLNDGGSTSEANENSGNMP